MNISAKQLKYFLAVAKHKNFQKAADECAISQPALSMKIKELENDLGQLIERGSKKFYLTQTGQALIDKAETIIQSFDDLKHLANKGSKISKLAMGVIPTIGPYLLPRILEIITKNYPGIILEPKETITEKLIEQVINGRLDMAILALPINEQLLVEFPLFYEEFLLIRNKFDINKPIPDSNELSKMNLLLLEEGHCLRSQTLSFCKINSAPKNSFEATTLSTLVQMVNSRFGVTLIPEMAIPFETKLTNVLVSRFKKNKPRRQIGLIWRKNNSLSEKLKEIALTLKCLNSSKNKMHAKK